VPEVLRFDSPAAELQAVQQLVADFRSSGRQSLGILCKTRRQAAQVQQALQDPGVQLLTAESTTFKEGVVITTAYLAKGLEFDEVIVPFASAASYKTEIDKGMLYVACTRAMHQLSLTHVGAVTPFLA
jgi:DNA helicase-2/ATP-dependent DNA helicase PcrA